MEYVRNAYVVISSYEVERIYLRLVALEFNYNRRFAAGNVVSFTFNLGRLLAVLK